MITDVDVEGIRYRGAAPLMDKFIEAIKQGKYLVGMTFYRDLEIDVRLPIRFIRTLCLITQDASQAWEYRYDTQLGTVIESIADPSVVTRETQSMHVSNPYDEVAVLRQDTQAMQRRTDMILELSEIPEADTAKVIEHCEQIWPGRSITLVENQVMVGKKPYKEAAKQELSDIASISKDMNVPVKARPTGPFLEGVAIFADMLEQLNKIAYDENMSPLDKANLCMEWMARSRVIIDDPRCPASEEEKDALKAESAAIMREVQESLNQMIQAEMAEPPLYVGYPTVSSDIEPYFSIPAGGTDHYFGLGTDLSINTGSMFSSVRDVTADWFLDLDPDNTAVLEFMDAHVTGEFYFTKEIDFLGRKHRKTEAIIPVYCTDPIQLARGEFPDDSEVTEDFVPGRPLDFEPYAVSDAPVTPIDDGPLSWLTRLFR
jgi:hypothetical protein